jgi:molybdopterin molybdotransferase
MTGAPVPVGSDAVVKIEDVLVLGEDASCPEGREVQIFSQVASGQNIRLAGEEAHAGDVLLSSGIVINAASIGLMATCGYSQVPVYRRPRVAVVSSGSELVEHDQIPGPGQIRNSNTFALAAAAADAGAIVTILPKVDDTKEAFLRVYKAAAQEHDMVVMSGGAAEGDFDYTTSTIRELGEVFFNKVNMKPGKAQTFGVIDGTPVFGLPGNPTAAAVGFEILVRPALRKMQGYTELQRPLSTARISQFYKKREGRREYLRGRLTLDSNGDMIVSPAKNQSSALLKTLADGNCLIVLPEGDHDIEAASEVSCLRLDLPEGVINRER